MPSLEELQAQYDEFADSLRAQGIPLPSLQILALAIILVIAGIYVLIAQPFSPATTSLEVTIVSGNSPVEKALVQVYSAENAFISEALTSSDGKANFGSVPKSGIMIKAEKGGIGNATKRLQAAPQKITIPIGDAADSNQTSVRITLEILDEATSRALQGATISYTFSDDPAKKYSASSGRDGRALFTVPAEKALNLAVLHSDYDSKLFSIAPKRDQGVVEVRLQKRATPSAVPSALPQFEFGTLRVKVADEAGSALDAGVDLFDAVTNSIISSKLASGGRASFPSLLTGARFYVKAKLQGYSDHDGSLSPVEIGKQNEIEVLMRKIAGVSQGKIRVMTVDEEGNGLPAEVQVLTVERSVLTKASAGEAAFEISQLSSLESIRFSASADGKLPSASEIFSPDSLPAEVTLVLPSATAENSALLSVDTKDRDGNDLAGVEVRVYSPSEGLLTSARTDSSATAPFLLQKNSEYSIIGEYNAEKGAASLFLSEGKTLPLFIGAAVETLSLSAINAISGGEVEATFYVSYAEETFDSCFGSSCTVFAKTLVPANLKATADGYFDYSSAIIASSEGKPMVVELIPSDLREAFVKFLGIYDSLGRKAEELQAGEEYSAKLLVALPGSDRLGAYLRVGKASGTGNDIAAITGFSSASAPSGIIKSAAFSASSTCIDEPSIPESKWLNLEFEKTASQEITFKIKVNNKAEREAELPIYHRGYAVKGNQFLRIPQDGQLLTNEKTAALDWCKAKAAEVRVPIRKQGQYSCNPLGCLSVLLEQDGVEAFQDFQARNAKNCDAGSTAIPNSCALSSLKIKAIFSPNDASKEFDLKVTQQNARIRLAEYSLNGAPPSALSTSSLSLPLGGSDEYSLQMDSLPQENGDEKITVSVQDANSDLGISRSVQLKIYGSCENAQKDCGGGVCAPICLGDYFQEGDDGEEVPEPPECGGGQFYCLDGFCREDCGASLPRDYTRSLEISFKGGNILLSSSKIRMQVDGIAPFDAVPLNFTGNATECRLLYSISGGSTKSCYAIENDNLIFRGKELSASCPLESKGNDAQGDKSAKLKIVCAEKSLTPVEVPIEVIALPSRVKAVQFQPRSVAGSASKIMHVINQKQVPRDYSMEELEVPFEHADAYSYAWGGTGTLELRDGGEPVDSITYSASESYFPGIDNQGGRTPYCYDYLCCTGKWCTSAAATQAFDAFKKMAQQVSEETVFRRGNNYLADKVLKKPFAFSTIIRLVEKARLPSGIQLEDMPSDYGCLDENPKIYVLQGSTRDGRSWKYSARIARLYKFQYVSPEEACKGSALAPASEPSETHSYESAGNYLALCDFLRGSKGCIESERDAGFADIEQVANPKQLQPNFGVSAFFRILVLQQVCAPGTTMTDFDLPDVRIPRWTVMTCPVGAVGGAGATCLPKDSYVYSDVKGGQFRATVHLGIDQNCRPDYKGLAIGAAGAFATYKYPEHAKAINALTQLISLLSYGDLTTCRAMQALAVATPSEYALPKAGLGVSCEAISKMKEGWKKIFDKPPTDDQYARPVFG